MCIFCNNNFPFEYQLIYDFKNWVFVHDINPIRSFHCLLVIKEHCHGFENISNQEVITEFGEVLRICISSIKKSTKDIQHVTVLSLNLGENSKHLHFHLIPIFKKDKIKSIIDNSTDGSGINFLGNRENIQDGYRDYIKEVYGMKSKYILEEMDIIKKEEIKEKVKILKDNIEQNEL